MYTAWRRECSRQRKEGVQGLAAGAISRGGTAQRPGRWGRGAGGPVGARLEQGGGFGLHTALGVLGVYWARDG